MAHEIRRVDFRSPRPFTDFRIHHFGLWRRRGWPLPTASRSLVISPYLVGSVVQRLRKEHGLDVLISRPEAFQGIVRSVGREALPETCYVLSPGADLDSREAHEEDEETDTPAEPAAARDEVELAGLHAKLFLFENGREARLFTGSANATAAAFGLNVEVLVELVGTKKDCGIASLLGSEDDAQLETLRSLLQEYQPASDPEPDDPKQELERKAERFARMLGAARLTANVRDADAEERWDITLSGQLPEIPSGVTVTVWPATLSSEAAQGVTGPAVRQSDPDSRANRIATFNGLSFEALTGFFAFEVSVREGQHTVRQRFVVTAELVGAPENRKERLLRSLLKDRRRVLRLLLLILMDEGADVSAFVDAAGQDGSGADGSFGGWREAALLEALLQSLSDSPVRIDEAARLIADLEKTEEGKELLPDGLNEIWEPVWQARKAAHP